jgi:hypothetical protein
MATPEVAVVRCHATDEVGMPEYAVGVEIVEKAAHLIGMFLIHAEDDGLPASSSFGRT